jgi:hypothetical protein
MKYFDFIWDFKILELKAKPTTESFFANKMIPQVFTAIRLHKGEKIR